VKQLALLILIAVAAKADILYTWTVTNSYNQSASYSFSVPDFPQNDEIRSNNVTISGYVGLPSYSCQQRSAENCVATLEFASAPNSFTDLNTNFGQAAMVVCWDADWNSCTTGFDIMTGADFPDLDIHQFGTYYGTMVDAYGMTSTELVITDPPSSVPEPASVWLLLAGANLFLLYRLWICHTSWFAAASAKTIARGRRA